MNQSKYFDYGFPASSRMPMYGIYHLVLDRFILVTNSENYANKIKLLLSSKYMVAVICLNSAINYKFGTISNANCERWTINKQNTNIQVINAMVHNNVVSVGNLIANNNESDLSYAIEQKEWALFCLYWIKRISSYQTSVNNYLYFDSNIDYFLEIDNLGYQTSIDQVSIKKVLKTLYLANSIPVAEQELASITF